MNKKVGYHTNVERKAMAGNRLTDVGERLRSVSDRVGIGNCKGIGAAVQSFVNEAVIGNG